MNKEEFVQTILTIAVFVLIFLMLSWLGFFDGHNAPISSINSFEQCVEAGYPVMESYPRQCRVPGAGLFVEDVSVGDGQEFCIQVITPARNSETGETRDFPTSCDIPEGWETIR